MRRGIGCGLQTVIILIIIYLTEMTILGLVHGFLVRVPYKFVAPPVVMATILVAWIAIYIDMRKRGGR